MNYENYQSVERIVLRSNNYFWVNLLNMISLETISLLRDKILYILLRIFLKV